MAESGSFTQAGEKLNVSTAAVNKQINLLEKSLGVSLLNRSPRHMSLTEIGHHFYNKFKKIIEKMDEVKQFAGANPNKLTGHLRIYGCAGLINYFIVPHLAEFTSLNPLLTIEIHNIDYVPNFYKEEPDIFVGIDNANTILQKCDVVAAPLIEYRYIYCASPTYLGTHVGQKIEVVNDHCYISPPAPINDMLLDQNPEMLFKPKHLIKVNSNYSSLHATLNGIGIARIPDFMANVYIKTGQLKHIFTKQDSKLVKAYLFYKKHRYPELKIMRFKKFIQDKVVAR